ncbi:MAG TPA: hypothetical protein VN695_01990 [Streptosporangiaceae bacterium]|nr:hypothetical protein [Streptosporangiaceae bacterium]
MTDIAAAKRELDIALNCFTEALGLVDPEKDPGYYGVILHDIADAHVAAGSMEEAISSYTDAMTYKLKRVPVHPGDLATTIEALADCLITCGELERARATLGKLRDILPQIAEPEERAIHLHGVGRAFERLADEGLDDTSPDALAAYKEAAQLLDRDKDPGFYGVIMHDIGDIQLAGDNLTEAVAAYREAATYKLKQTPPHPGDLTTTMLALSDCLVETGELAQARTILGQIAEVLPQIEDQAQRASRLHRLGAALQRLGSKGQADAYAEALAAYQDALKLLDPAADAATYATVLNDVGSIYKAQEKYNDARDAYEQAVQHMRDTPNGKHHLVPMLIDLGRIRLQIISRKQSLNNAGQDS